MTTFVTGGTGFVGSHLVEALLATGRRVRALVRSDPKWLKGLDVEIVRGDLGAEGPLRDALAGVDEVFHVAGLTRAPTEQALIEANLGGTATLLRAVRAAAPDVRRVVVTSSLAAVGPSPAGASGVEPLTEAHPLRPISAYGRSKAAMELALARDFADMPVVVVRPPAVYGPRETDIFTVIRAAARQRIFPIAGSPDRPVMSLVHVRDLVDGLLACTEAPAGETYFVASERGYSWGEIRDAVAAALGHRLLTLRIPLALVPPAGALVESIGALFGSYPPLNREKAREAREAWVCSVEKARREIGFRQRVALAEGIQETVTWYRQQGWM
jgi:dihydroflavonol-4-reductase